MEQLGIETVQLQEHYLLFVFNYTKLCSESGSNNPIISSYFPTLEMAEDVYLALEYFIYNWDRGFDGGELGSGVRRGDAYKWYGVVPPNAIGSRLFIKLDENTLINGQGITLDIPNFVAKTTDLNKNKRTKPLRNKEQYDEYLLSVLRWTKFPPRIKRQSFSFNPFKYDFVETDEATVRKMRLVV